MNTQLLIDFDCTLFDTDAMKVALGEERIRRVIAGLEFFRRDELSKFIYSDARAFLASDSSRHTLISLVAPTTTMPTSLSFQSAKISASGILSYFSLRIIADEAYKGPIVSRHCASLGIDPQHVVVIDDRQDQLDSVTEHCPDARTVRIDRTRSFGNECNVIASFADLPRLLRRIH